MAQESEFDKSLLSRFGPILAAAMALLIGFGFLYHLQFLSSHLPGTDPYFHIKFSYLTRTEGLLQTFPWATQSWWRDHFADKSFLYHVLLIPFTYFDNLALGAKWSAVVIGSLVLLSFYLILVLNRSRYPMVWLLLLGSTGGIFIYRINVPRPQGLSVLLALWSMHFVINNKKISFTIITFVYSLSYTIMLPVLFALGRSAAVLLRSRKIEWQLPLLAVISLTAGMLASPYFPDNFRWFLFPNLYIPFLGATGAHKLNMGSEFTALTTGQLLSIGAAVVLPYLAAFLTALFAPRQHSEKTLILFLNSLGLIILSFSMKRFGEYSIPITLIFTALFFTEYYPKLSFRQLLKQFPVKTGIATLLLAAFLAGQHVNSYRDMVPQFEVEETGFKDAALFLLHETKPGEVVFTCDWDDAPFLFHYNHSNRYLVFLDPTFMYVWNPEIWEEWSHLAQGYEGPQTYNKLKKFARYGVCTRNFDMLRRLIMRDERMNIIFGNRDVYVFRLD